jgi:hypothetical protein
MNKGLQIFPFFTDPDYQKSQQLLNDVIEKSYQIAFRYLRYHHRRIINILSREDLTLQELAIDSIAELFVETENNGLTLLQETFIKWEPRIKTEDETLFFLNKVVASKVEQNIFKLLKEEDPFFSKLLDSVNYLIKQNGYQKTHFLGKTYITENGLDEINKEFITSEEFDRLPSELFSQKKFLLKNILNYLKLETDFITAIPLNDLVIRLKQINFADYLIAESENVLSKKIEIKELVQIGLRAVNEKLNHTYLEKNKLTQEEITAIESALKEMALDLSNGGVSPGLYSYLFPHIKGLSEIDYKEKYHNILEYLLKVMKSTIAEELLGKR